MKLRDFRRQLLDALHDARALRPKAQLHLLYAPELADPLALAEEPRRDTARMRPPRVAADWPEQAWPRIVTFDCRRVAPYLLETDASLDDPLLEASITHAHAEVWLGQRVRVEVTNDDPGMAQSAVCGWIVSAESAAQMSERIQRHAALFNSGNRRRWVRWYQPACIGLLWPLLTPLQQQALLGPAAWLAHDAAGRLQCFESDAAARLESQESTRFLSVAQWAAVDNQEVVADLVRRWQALCAAEARELPPDAAHRLHGLVQQARGHRLDAEDLAVFALLSVQLREGATSSPEFLRLLDSAQAAGGALRDVLADLSELFWRRYLPADATPEQTLRRAMRPMA
jgi:hypothetical protein